jgi:hypothetical protein
MNKNCTKDDSEINELSEDEENAQEDIGSHQHFLDESCDAIAAQTVISMPPRVLLCIAMRMPAQAGRASSANT